MAATIFKIAASSSRMKVICCFRGPAFSHIQPRLLLPACGSSIIGHQRNILHTSSKKEKQMLYELAKDRKGGTGHWLNERMVAVGILALMPAAYAYPMQLIDHGFAILIPLHSYWGIKAIIGDYIWRPIVPITKIAWLVISVLSSLGLIYLNVNDVGITKLFSQFLTL